MKARSLTALAVAAMLGACATTTPAPAPPDSATAAVEPAPEPVVEPATRPFPDDSLHELLVAEFAVRRGHYDLALGNYLQQAHETRDPGVAARASRLAQFLRADRATLDAAQLWVELEPDSLEAQYTLATMLAKQQRPREALQHMTQVLEQDGQTNFAAIAASSLQLPEEQRAAVEADLDTLNQRFPDNTQLMTAKALMLQQRGEYEAALALIRQVLQLNPDDLHAVVVEARLLQHLDRPDEAFTRLQQVVTQHPHNRRLRLQYARMLMSRDIGAAREQFELLLASTPEDPDLLLSLGLICKETEQLDDARTYFSRLLDTGERTTEALYYLGQLAEANQDWQQAIDYYLQIPPGDDFIAAVNRVTELYLQQGRSDEARDYLRDLRQQHPEHSVRFYLFESEVLLSGDDYQQGQQLLDEALMVHNNQVNLLWARSMFSEKLGDYSQMTADLEKVIQQDPDNAVALNALGYTLANRGQRLQEARGFIQRALALKPDDPAILDSLGWVEYRLGNQQQAIALLTRAYQQFPDHEVAAHLGEVLWVSGQPEQAIDIWQQGLSKTPDSPIIAETLQRLGVPPEAIPALNP